MTYPTKTVKITHVPIGMWKRVKAAAAYKGLGVSQWVIMVIRMHLEKTEDQ